MGGSGEAEGAAPVLLGGPKGGPAHSGPLMGKEASSMKSTQIYLLNQISTSALTVPFLCYMDAELAYQYLTSSAEFYHEAIHTELRVVGSDLFM